MKITRSILKQIIKEELENIVQKKDQLLNEAEIDENILKATRLSQKKYTAWVEDLDHFLGQFGLSALAGGFGRAPVLIINKKGNTEILVRLEPRPLIQK